MKVIFALFSLALSLFSLANDIVVSGQVPHGYSLKKVYLRMASTTESSRCSSYHVMGLGVMMTGVKFKWLMEK